MWDTWRLMIQSMFLRAVPTAFGFKPVFVDDDLSSSGSSSGHRLSLDSPLLLDALAATGTAAAASASDSVDVASPADSGATIGWMTRYQLFDLFLSRMGQSLRAELKRSAAAVLDQQPEMADTNKLTQRHKQLAQHFREYYNIVEKAVTRPPQGRQPTVNTHNKHAQAHTHDLQRNAALLLTRLTRFLCSVLFFPSLVSG